MRKLFLPLTLMLVCFTIQAAPAVDCTVRASVLKGPNANNQYLLFIRTDPRCQEVGRLTRILTHGGGKLPPFGYFKLGDGAPLFVSYWVFKGARVQDRSAPNVWNDVPIRGASW